MPPRKQIYFDCAASTPVDPRVVAAMRPFFSVQFGNPSSLHTPGRAAAAAIDSARASIAQFLGCSATEIVFTSGATEADNLAIRGVVAASTLRRPHIITSVIEHPAVLETVRALESEGLARVDYVPVGVDGVVKFEAVKKLIRPTTVLISLMYANNEVGTIQPVRDIGKLLERLNRGRAQRIYLHTDAVQAINYLNCDVGYLRADLLSLSGHKIYGPKGVGALFVRSGVKIKSVLHGGSQEGGLRPGTLNTPLIVGLAEAVKLLRPQRDAAVVRLLRDQLYQQLLKKIPKLQINGSFEKRLPNNLNFSCTGVEGERLMLMLDSAGMAVSTGSACASGSIEPSHVLLAMGLPAWAVAGSIRLTLGRGTTAAEVNYFLRSAPAIIRRAQDVAWRAREH
ncbi:cysteine desulfurase [Candidatus Falkowbacteria bacterium]|nr:cysteine desulfurase [Candidatus Falkowbacteria bacterium]